MTINSYHITRTNFKNAFIITFFFLFLTLNAKYFYLCYITIQEKEEKAIYVFNSNEILDFAPENIRDTTNLFLYLRANTQNLVLMVPKGHPLTNRGNEFRARLLSIVKPVGIKTHTFDNKTEQAILAAIGKIKYVEDNLWIQPGQARRKEYSKSIPWRVYSIDKNTKELYLIADETKTWHFVDNRYLTEIIGVEK